MVKKKIRSVHKRIKHGASRAKNKAVELRKWILLALILIVLFVIMRINQIQFTFL